MAAAREAASRAKLYRAWHMAHRTGAGHEQALAMAGAGTGPVEQFRQTVMAGSRDKATLAESLERARSDVEPFESALLAAGEESGTLEQSLRLLADFFAAEEGLLRRLNAKLAYPLFLAFAAAVLLPLPALVAGRTTGYVLASATAVGALLLFGGTPVMALRRRYARRSGATLGRFARVLASSVEAGLPLDRSARLAAAAADDRRITSHLSRIDDRMLVSHPLSETLRGCPGIPASFHGSLRVAEETGDYSTTLRRLGEMYEEGFR